MIHRLLKPFNLLTIAILLFTTLLPVAPVMALTNQDISDINDYTSWYDPNSTVTAASDCGTDDASGGTTEVPSAIQAANAQVIIGIAKTDNLGEAGAVIGVMVALDESSLTNLANSTVKSSLSDPNAQGSPGDNADSVGIFQQRPVEGWSTLGDGDDQPEVYQLMTPAYAAEAFFGSPTGSGAPSALSQGLQDQPGWQNVEPWVAAQEVQNSADKTGSNYEKAYGPAKTLVDQYWESAAAVPLPVAITGGTTATTGGSDDCASTPTDFGTGTGKFTDTNTTVESAPDGETVAQWLVRVKETAIINPPSTLFQQLCGSKTGDGQVNCKGMCDYLQGALWGYSNSGYFYANLQWAAEKASGHAHPGDRNPPVGALLFYTNSDQYGHVAAYVGNNEVVSTDVGDGKSGVTGGVYVLPASDLEGGIWNLPYLGWSDPNFTGGTL